MLRNLLFLSRARKDASKSLAGKESLLLFCFLGRDDWGTGLRSTQPRPLHVPVSSPWYLNVPDGPWTNSDGVKRNGGGLSLRGKPRSSANGRSPGGSSVTHLSSCRKNRPFRDKKKTKNWPGHCRVVSCSASRLLAAWSISHDCCREDQGPQNQWPKGRATSLDLTGTKWGDTRKQATSQATINGEHNTTMDLCHPQETALPMLPSNVVQVYTLIP